jgi:hypothetical protein
MIGMNVIFHLGSALLIGGLIYLWLRALAERDLFRLVTGASANPRIRKFKLAAPAKFLAEFCGLLQIPLENSASSDGMPQRVDLQPLGELLLSPRPTLIRWKNQSVIEIVSDGPQALIWQRGLAAAFGASIQVVTAVK